MKIFSTLSLLFFLLIVKAQNNALNFYASSVISGNNVSLPYNSTLDFSTNTKFSIEGWFKTTANTAVIYSNLVDQDPFTGHEVAIVNTKLVFAQCNNHLTNALRIETVNSYNDGNWHHFACVYKGIPDPSNVDIYVDGTIQSQYVTDNNLSGSINSLNESHVGSRDNTTYFIDGTLDEIRVWGKALTELEVVSRKNCQLMGNEPGLLAYFDFNQGIANANNVGITSLNDKSGHNLTGTLTDFVLNGISSNWVAGPAEIVGNCVVANPVSLNEFGIQSSFIHIYPNPGKGEYSLSGLDKGTSIHVFNSVGQLIYESVSESEGKTELNIASQNAGIYIIKCNSASGQTFSKRIIKE